MQNYCWNFMPRNQRQIWWKERTRWKQSRARNSGVFGLSFTVSLKALQILASQMQWQNSQPALSTLQPQNYLLCLWGCQTGPHPGDEFDILASQVACVSHRLRCNLDHNTKCLPVPSVTSLQPRFFRPSARACAFFFTCWIYYAGRVSERASPGYGRRPVGSGGRWASSP